MNEALSICCRLLREGAVPRAELGDLDRSDVRREVEERLKQCGFMLAMGAYSEHVGVRLTPEGAQECDAASNLKLAQDALTLITISWVRLVMRKRTGEVGPPPQMRLTTLVREFGDKLGSRHHIRQLVGRLRNLRFLAGEGELIEPGPFLELGIDGVRMRAYIEGEILRSFIPAEGPDDAELDAQPDEQFLKRVLEEIRALGGKDVRMRDLRDRKSVV